MDTLGKSVGKDGGHYIMPSPEHEKFNEETGEWEMNKALF